MNKQRERLVELLGKELMDYASWQTEMALAGNYNMPSVEEVIVDKILADGWMRPPVKVGDTVYTLGHRNRKAPVEWKVVGVWFSEDESCNYMYLYWYKDKDNFVSRQVDFSLIGKTVFLTREEAETALKGDVKNEVK
jgi:hypothetical protein